MRFEIFAVAFVLSACAGQSIQPALLPAGAPRTTLTSDVQEAVQQAVRDQLKDPESARFTDLVAYEGPRGLIHVCGRVNAKNGFGGYGGPVPFEADATPSGSDYHAMATIADGTDTGVQAFYMVIPLCAQ